MLYFNLDKWTYCVLSSSAASIVVLLAIAASDAQQLPAFECPIGRHGRPIVVPLAIADDTAFFLLDTGSAITLCDQKLVSLGVQPIGKTTIRTPAGESEVNIFRRPPAKLGSVNLDAFGKVAFVDLAPLRAVTGQPIQGALGYDVLQNFAMEIDFDEGRLRLWNRAPQSWRNDQALAIHHKMGTPHLSFALPTGREELIAVDTGANISTLRTDVFDALAASSCLTPLEEGFAATIQGFGDSRLGRIARLQLGDYRHDDIRMDRSALSAAGLPYLARYRLRLDFPGRAAYLAPSSRYDLVDSTYTSGMAVLFLNGNKTVYAIVPHGPADMAGIRCQDIIELVNGQSAEDLDMFSFAQVFTNKTDAGVRVVVRRASERISAVVIPRDRRPLPSLTAAE